MRVYHNQDASTGVLRSKTIAVLGYGSQGRAQAQCFRDSGLHVIIGSRKNGKSWNAAKKDNFKVVDMTDAVKQSDVICMLTSDASQKEVYEKYVVKNLARNKALYFSHGFAITYGLIRPPKNIDVIMLAPHGPGKQLRELYLEGKGLPALLAVHQNASGKAKRIALALAKACGFTRAGVFESTFQQETYADLFAEQAVLCGGVSELVRAAYDAMVEEGIPPHLAWFCSLYELKLTTDLIHKEGIEGMWKQVSGTAHYGGRTRGPRIINAQSRKEMKKMLAEIKSGKFAQELAKEAKKGMPKLRRLSLLHSRHQIERTGSLIRRKFRL
ncbi:MAG: ketol-acid reductoisomerase [Candidatus Micrarchaeia archaeon]|jgi:ketol-acid reductoisomerase